MTSLRLLALLLTSALVAPLAAHSFSPAERVVRAGSHGEILAVMAEGALHLPGKEKHHFETQYVHMRRRQLTATNAIRRIAKFLIGASKEEERRRVAFSQQLQDLCVCALHPLPELRAEDAYSFCDAIRCLGQLAPLQQSFVESTLEPMVFALLGFLLKHAHVTSLTGVDVALGKLGGSESTRLPLRRVLEEQGLPFRHHHALVKGSIQLSDIMNEVKFSQDTFTTMSGKRVLERRGTCWMAEESVGGEWNSSLSHSSDSKRTRLLGQDHAPCPYDFVCHSCQRSYRGADRSALRLLSGEPLPGWRLCRKFLIRDFCHFTKM